ADMLVEDGRREAKGAGIDRLAEQRLDLRRLVGCGRALHRRLAHHVVAERGQGRQDRFARFRPVASVKLGNQMAKDIVSARLSISLREVDRALEKCLSSTLRAKIK